MLSGNQIPFYDHSFSSSWSSMLYNVLKRPSYSLAAQASNRTRLRHCSGNIWKHFLSASIYHDLASIPTSCDNPARRLRTTLRRFVRLEHIGLSGVILYEIRMGSACCSSQDDCIGVGEYLTMQRVFGDLGSSATDHNMDLDDLLDVVDAKVIYFPTYACTSFIAGQVMNAHLSNRPELMPISAFSGFSIPIAKSLSEILIPEIGQSSDGNVPIDDPPISCLPSGFHLQEAFSLADDDPYLALCVRISSLDSFGFSLDPCAINVSDYEEAEDVGDSTNDSLGPCTPPRLSGGLIPSGTRHMASQDSSRFLPCILHLTEENEWASFIDFTGSFFEDIDTAIINEK